MEKKRTVRDCAEMIIAALRQASSLSRRELVDRSLVSADDAERGLRWLRETGKIRRSPLSTGREARVVRYELTDGARDTILPVGRHRSVCFERLLAAWRIRLPSATFQRKCRDRFVNDAFAQEERRELAELHQATRRIPSGRGRRE